MMNEKFVRRQTKNRIRSLSSASRGSVTHTLRVVTGVELPVPDDVVRVVASLYIYFCMFQIILFCLL